MHLLTVGDALADCWCCVGEVPEDVGLDPPCTSQREEDKAEVDAMSNKARLKFVCTRLWPYTIPLVVVYVSEYAMQSGAW